MVIGGLPKVAQAPRAAAVESANRERLAFSEDGTTAHHGAHILNYLLRIIDGTVIDELAGHHLHVARYVEDWLQSPCSGFRVPTLRDNHLLGLGFVGGIGGIRDCATKHEGSCNRSPQQNGRNEAQAQCSHSYPLDLFVRGRWRWMPLEMDAGDRGSRSVFFGSRNPT